MPLETGTTIEQLDKSWPLGGDPTNKGDDHLRLIKSILKTQFPGINGNGYNAAITATEQELNWLVGLTSNVQDQINSLDARVNVLESSLPAPAGTRLVFHQAAPPTGWTQDITLNDYMMRVVSTAGGGSAGTDSPILNNKVSSHTHVASSNTTGNHTHTLSNLIGANAPNTIQTLGGGDIGVENPTTSPAGDHSHIITVNANSGASDWTPRYTDLIIGVKD